MPESIALVLAGIAGTGLGAFFFGGLWWSTRKGVSAETPALWFLGSFLLRTTAVLAGFYFVSAGHWQRLVACLVGFALSRAIAKRAVRPRAAEASLRVREGGHAPQS